MHAESRRCNLISTTFITNLNGQFRVLPFSRAPVQRKEATGSLLAKIVTERKDTAGGQEVASFAPDSSLHAQSEYAGPPGVPGGLQGHTWVHFLPLSSRQPAGAGNPLSILFRDAHTPPLSLFAWRRDEHIYIYKRRNNIMEHAAGVCRVQASRGATLATYLHSSSPLILME